MKVRSRNCRSSQQIQYSAVSNTLSLSPTSILSRNTFTFIPNSQSNTLSDDLRDRKALYLDSEHSTGRKNNVRIRSPRTQAELGGSRGSHRGRSKTFRRREQNHRQPRNSSQRTPLLLLKNLPLHRAHLEARSLG